jgi:hypothetical protein
MNETCSTRERRGIHNNVVSQHPVALDIKMYFSFTSNLKNFKFNFLQLRHCTTCFGLPQPSSGALKLV